MANYYVLVPSDFYLFKKKCASYNVRNHNSESENIDNSIYGLSLQSSLCKINFSCY
jgi:hypothetical protein